MHIILYILDELRADHLGCYGYERDTSPHIDSIAREGILFEHCFTASTWTRPVAASILTGTYPSVHKAQTRNDMFSTPLIRLPEVFKKAGFKTAGFATIGMIASEIGFAKGFDVYHDLFRDPGIVAKRQIRKTVHKQLSDLLNENTLDIALPLAEDINDFLIPWLSENSNDETFSFIWSIETHEPYIAPVEYRRFSPRQSLNEQEGWPEDIMSAGPKDRQRLIDLYDNEIYYNDYCIGQIVKYLKQAGVYDDTLLIITSDHGQSFNEHGIYGHGNLPYDEQTHVPLLIKLPSADFSGKRVSDTVELIDIFPTLTEASSLNIDDKVKFFLQGKSLIPLIKDQGSWEVKLAFSDTNAPSEAIAERYFSVQDKDWKIIKVQQSTNTAKRKNKILTKIRKILSGEIPLTWNSIKRYFRLRNFNRKQKMRYLFNLQNDPGETNNLIDSMPEIAHKYFNILEDQNNKNNLLAENLEISGEHFEENESLKQHLKDLGYL